MMTKTQINYKTNAQSFKPNFCADKNDKKETKPDPLMSNPLRLCAYTNEVGAALAPIPEIGGTLFKLSWIPALMYFGADIYDKYAKGESENYDKPSKSNALKQAIFQGLASVLLPTAAVIMGQNVFSNLSQHYDKNKMDVRAKEDLLKELKRDLNQDRLRNYRHEIREILKDNPDMDLNNIKQHEKIKKIKETLNEQIYKELKTECDTLRQRRQNHGIFKKIFEVFIHSHRDCDYVARIKESQFEQKVKPYLKEQIEMLVDTRTALLRAINPDGTLNEHSKDLDSKTVKKITNLLLKNRENKEITSKARFVIKESLLSKINKASMKLSVIKILGGFAALAIFAKPIDQLVEHIVISKFVEPGIDTLEKKFSTDK